MRADDPSPGRILLYQFGAVVLLLAAAFGTFVAWLAWALDENPTGRSWDVAQLVIAVGGLASTVGMVNFAFQRRWRAAAIALATSVLLYAVWAVLFDAAVHGGWGRPGSLLASALLGG